LRADLAGVLLAVNLVIMCSIALCPLFYEIERAPAVLRSLVGALPPSLATELLAAGWHSTDANRAALVALGLWAGGTIAVGLRRFTWTEPS
jgi:hypothetical protein